MCSNVIMNPKVKSESLLRLLHPERGKSKLTERTANPEIRRTKYHMCAQTFTACQLL